MLQSTMRHYIASLFLIFAFSTLFTSAQSTAQSTSQLDAFWSTIPTENEPNERHENGFVAYNGKLYLLGGRGLKRTQIFDPETNTWTDGAFPNFQMHHFQAVVHNNLIYVVGAYSGTCCDAEFGVSHVWIYNPQVDGWSQAHEIPEGRRRGSTGAVVYNDKIYIVGGLDGGHGDPATAYKWFDEYDPSTGQWKVLPDAPRVRDHFHATVYNGKLYLIGGRNTSVSSITGATIAEIDVYDFATGSWSTLDSSKNLPTPRGAPASILYQGEILVIGGETSGQTLAHNETEAFDPVAQTWSTLGSLVVGRHGTQAALLDNAIYLAAGSAQKGGSPELDSIEKYEDGTVQIIQREQSMQPGWNMIGLPVNPSDSNFESVYDEVDLANGLQPMTWDGNSSYTASSNLSIGKGYWLKIDDNASNTQNQTLFGTSIDALQVQLTEGWNMISGPSCDNVILLGSSTDPTGAIPESSLYLFDDGYVPAYNSIFQRGRLDQGIGYWVYASNDAILTMQCGGSKTEAVAINRSTNSAEAALGKLTISDASLKSRQLLFTSASNQALNSEAYNLPPRSYRGYFDARFRNNKRLIESNEADIRISASTWPITVGFDAAPEDRTGKLVVTLPDNKATYDLYPGESVELHDSEIEMVHMRFVDELSTEHPTRFTLHGNYPNPFNPTTRIAFDLPEDAAIEIQVIDMLGREMMRKSIDQVAAGSQRSVEIDASNLPAGTYLYRVTAASASERITSTGRMVLLK